MKKIVCLLLLMFACRMGNAQTQTFHDFTVISITGDTIPLSQYYGKKVLAVNTASFCGYTYQFGLLQALDSMYKQYNFAVVGFPCNDFGGQDPYNDSTILSFCTRNYGVTFQMMSKVAITSVDTADVYKWLQRQNLNGVANVSVSWNFNKFCIDEAGHWVRHFDSPTLPTDTAITNWIMTASVLGVQQSMPEQQLNMYWQSQDENLLINTGNLEPYSSIDLFDMNGKNKFHLDKQSGAVASVIISTADLPAGMYVVRLLSGKEIKTGKMMIVR